MKKNMMEWKNSILESDIRMAMPVMTYPGLELTGESLMDMVSDGKVQYNSVKALTDRYPSSAGVTLAMALYVEAEAFGSKVNYNGNEIPTISDRLLSSFSSLPDLRIPSVGDGKTSEYLKAARLAAENITDRPVFGGIIGPFSLGGRLYDISEMMAAILIEPDSSHKLLCICTDFLKKYALAYKEAGCDGIIIAEPAAGLLATDECHKFSSYYVRQIVDYVQDESFLVILHNCGNTETLVNSMVSTGSAGFHFGNAVDMLDILPQIPSDRLVFGNLNPAGILKDGTPDQVKDQTLELLHQTTSFNNFVISTGCDIPPGTDPVNLDAFFLAVEEYNEGQSALLINDYSSLVASEL